MMYRRMFWLCFGVLLGGWISLHSASARAETIAATPVTAGPTFSAVRYSMNNSTWFLGPDAAAKNDYCVSLGGLWVGYNLAANKCYQASGTLSGVLSWGYVLGTSSCRAGYTYVNPNCVPVTTYTCPAGQNWTLSGTSCTRPDCVAPQTRNAQTGVCQSPPCETTGPATGTAWFDVGTSSEGGTRSVCIDGCQALYQGSSVSKSGLVNGVRHYYRQGSYYFFGGGALAQCTASAAVPAPGPASVDIPVSHCASNQIEGLIDGKLNCWNVPTAPGEPPTLAPTAEPATKTTGSSTSNVSTVGDTTTTTVTNINNTTGITTVNTTACTAGNCATTTQETSTGDPTEPTDENPGTPSAGQFPASGELVEADARTVQGVWDTRKAQLMATPLVGLASSLTSFPGGTGSCPSWAIEGNIFGQSQGGTISPPCWLWTALRAFLMLTALFVARRLIFGG